MNRQTILASVHRQLRESLAETGEARPLGEIVPRVANEIRSHQPSPKTNSIGIVSVERVAAFVDGQLQAEEAEAICDAVMVDNSVLAEIIAAVRANQHSAEQLPPLPASLSARLTAISSAASATNQAEKDADDRNGRVSRNDEPTALAAGLSSPRNDGTGPEANASGLRNDNSSSDRSTGKLSNGRSSNRGHPVQIAVGLLVIAATIVAAIVVLGRRSDQAPEQTTVVHSDVDQGVSERRDAPDVLPEAEAEQIPRDPLQGIVENELPASPSKQDDFDGDTPAMDPVAPKVIPEPQGATEEAIVEKRSPPTLETEPPIDPRVPRIPAPPRLAELRWDEVSGVLARRNEPIGDSSSRRVPTWSRIQQGATSSSSPTSTGTTRRVALRTLPFSRAKTQLEDGGRLVIAGDTGLQITRGTNEAFAELDLMYGSVALVGIAEGTVVKVQQGNQTIATLRWQTKASAVVNRQTTGLQIQVDRGEIEINDTPVREKSVQVAHDMTIESIPSPKRLPRWVTRGEESSGVERMILAQIADTDDLTASLNQKIVALASSPTLSRDEARALAKLAGWQASMVGPNLIRLAGSRVPALRLAALQRLTQLSETDPRFPRTWNTIRRSVNNPQRSDQIREWFRLVRTGSRPSAAQLEQMLGGLSAQSTSGRAISDFILRQYVRNAPPFDPTWTGQTLQRAINVYRQRAGVPVDRLRPNAAATVAP